MSRAAFQRGAFQEDAFQVGALLPAIERLGLSVSYGLRYDAPTTWAVLTQAELAASASASSVSHAVSASSTAHGLVGLAAEVSHE